jgi:hypothetical protein
MTHLGAGRATTPSLRILTRLSACKTFLLNELQKTFGSVQRAPLFDFQNKIAFSADNANSEVVSFAFYRSVPIPWALSKRSDSEEP